MQGAEREPSKMDYYKHKKLVVSMLQNVHDIGQVFLLISLPDLLEGITRPTLPTNSQYQLTKRRQAKARNVLRLANLVSPPREGSR